MRFCRIMMLLLFIGCHSVFNELPVLSYKINDEGEKINYLITYHDFTNQLGEPFTTKNIKNKVFIANFFFTRCPSICPPMRTELIKIANSFKGENDFLIISHTIDPENDSVKVLNDYSTATDVTSSLWQFVRSSEKNTRNQANDYMTNFKSNEDGSDFYHSSFVALIDKKQQIRGFYNILVSEEVNRLKTDIRTLLN